MQECDSEIDYAQIESTVRIINTLIETANSSLEKHENHYTDFAKLELWNIGETIDILFDYHLITYLNFTKFPFLPIDDKSKMLEINDPETLCVREHKDFNEKLNKIIYSAIKNKDIEIVEGKDKINNSLISFGLKKYVIISKLLQRIELLSNKAIRLNKFVRMREKYVYPESFLSFAERKGLKIPDRLRSRGIPSNSLKFKLPRKNPGNRAIWNPRDDYERHALKYMTSLLINGCKCRHDKLARLAFDNATDENGVLLKSYNTKQLGLLTAFIKKAKEIVPEERQFGEPKYDKNKCTCEIPGHQFKVPRRKKTYLSE